jgi:hypothetical protein
MRKDGYAVTREAAMAAFAKSWPSEYSIAKVEARL